MQSYHLYVGQVESLSLSLSLSLSFWKHVYVQVVVIVAHIFSWFYVQERLKRPLWVGDKLPSQFS
jgi:preprotein translocase subunit SecY